MFSLRLSRKDERKVLLESMDYMDIVEYLMHENFRLTDKEMRRMFYDINTKGKHTFTNGDVIELKELLF